MGKGGDLKICLFMTSLIQSVGIKDISEDTSVTWNLLASQDNKCGGDFP